MVYLCSISIFLSIYAVFYLVQFHQLVDYGIDRQSGGGVNLQLGGNIAPVGDDRMD